MAFQLQLESSFRTYPSLCATLGATGGPPPAACNAFPLSYSGPIPSGNNLRSLILRENHSSSIVNGFRSRKMSSLRCLSALTPELRTTLDKVVTSQKVVLFMKGTKEFPQCGFSNTVVQILMSLNVPFETINILENDILRQALKEYSSWPTFPQLYIDGELFGGCDITVGKFTSSSAWAIMREKKAEMQHRKYIWSRRIPLRISIFMWRLLHGWLPLDLVIQRNGVALASKCAFCNNMEDLDHLFATCPLSKAI